MNWKTEKPPENEVIIVETCCKKEQVTIRDGVAYLWRYKDTDQKFCDVAQIKRWRGCGGFDY